MGADNSKTSDVGQRLFVPPRATASSSAPVKVKPPGIVLIEGVHCLYTPPKGIEPEFDVVFIHGLKAGAAKDQWWTTWTVRGEGEAGTRCWPLEWLPKKFPRARVLALSYGSSAKGAKQQKFWESAINCLNGLISHDVGLGKRPYLMVGHSIGGLIAKEVLLRAATVAYKKEVGDNCKGLAFYGVPHLGTKADLNRVFGVVFSEGSELDLLGESCFRRNIDFKALEPRYPLYHFVETYETEVGNGTVMVVPQAVAAHNASADIMALIEADHFDVCKPFEKTDRNFAFLVNFIAAQLRKAKISYHGEVLSLT